MSLTTHDDKVAALTTYYSGILGGTTNTAWHFDIDLLYADREQAGAEPLLAPFSESEARCAVTTMVADSAPGPDGLGLGFYAAA